MVNFFGMLVRAYAALSGYVVALLLILVVVLLGTHTLSPERVKEALAVLRRKPEAAAKAAAPGAPKPAEAPSPERERQLERKAEELRRLEDRVGSQIAQMRGEQEALEKRRQDALAAEAAALKARQGLARAESDAEMTANLPILSKMDGAGIVGLLKGWNDPRIVKYLRALKPGKAAEVIEAIRTDPQFEEEFRRVPADAPPGTKSRAERLSEEFSKAP